MDPTVANSVASSPVHFLNVEYWFRLLYEIFFTGNYIDAASATAWLGELWLWVTLIGYTIAVLAIAVITYTVVRLFELRAAEQATYGPYPDISHEASSKHTRWNHIEELMHSANPNDWRTAIIEADIYLGDILTREGYHGTSIGDQLKQVDRSVLATIDDAWEAHKVRNEIAHQGSSFPLSESLALRTIGRYENVFRELHAL